MVALLGHHSYGWQIRDELRFHLSQSAYRQLAETVDTAFRQPVTSIYRDEKGEEFEVICTDGPGYLTERVAGERVISLAGFCGDAHPNKAIARAMFELLCPGLPDGFSAYSLVKEACRPLSPVSRYTPVYTRP